MSKKFLIDHGGRSSSADEASTNYGSTTCTLGGEDGASGSSFRSHRSQSFGDSVGSISKSMRDGLRRSLVFSGSNVSIRELGGHSTIPKSTFNLIKNLVGAGVLSLPNGVAFFADSPSAIVPATFWILIMGAIFGYYFQLIGKVCSITKRATFRETWEDTMGNNGATAISIVNMVMPAHGNLAYSMILADTFRSLFATAGFDTTRTESLLLITLMAILPLCLMKNLDSLAPFSIVGTVGICLTAVAMAWRYFDGSYDPARNGKFVKDLELDMQPIFGTYNGAWTSGVLVFCAMVFQAFVAHYNAPRFMAELKQPTMERYRTVVGLAFGAASLVYVLITAFGFLTFGGNCDGYILNNYSTNDELATFCRVAIAFSILFTYPIAFIGFRDGVLDVLEVPTDQQTSNNMNLITVVLLTLITTLAAIFTDLGFISAVGGGTLATAIVFVFPALMFRAVVKHPQMQPATNALEKEVQFAIGLMVVGILMGGIGVWAEMTMD